MDSGVLDRCLYIYLTLILRVGLGQKHINFDIVNPSSTEPNCNPSYATSGLSWIRASSIFDSTLSMHVQRAY